MKYKENKATVYLDDNVKAMLRAIADYEADEYLEKRSLSRTVNRMIKKRYDDLTTKKLIKK